MFRGSKETADKMVQQLHLGRRIDADMAMDRFNPEEKLPISANMEDQIPDFKPHLLSLAAPGDYTAHDQVAMVQSARANYLKEDLKYDNPKPSINYPTSTDFQLPPPPAGTQTIPRGFFGYMDMVSPQSF